MRAVKLKVRAYVSGLFAETGGGAHHFTGDGVDLAGREPILPLLLATPSKKGYDEEQEKWKRATPSCAGATLARRNLSCCRAPNEHRTLGGFFQRSLQEFEGFAEDGILGCQRARRHRFFLRIRRAVVLIGSIRVI